MSNATPPVILVDGSSYLYRAYHALPPLLNKDNEHTGAIYGVINMLNRLLNDYNPQYIAVVFDPKGKTFRHDLFTAYKANRTAMPDELREQIPPLFDIIRALGLPLLQLDNYEADDVIASLATMAQKENKSVLISTGDKDLTQLVSDQITLINTMSNTHFTKAAVKAKFGVEPAQMIDYLSLVGDSSDNIPGVKGVGAKTAAKWLETYGDIQTLCQHIEALPPKAAENLRNTLNDLPLYQELITIKSNLNLPWCFSELERQPPDYARLIPLYQRFEFKTWLRACPEQANAVTPKNPVNYHCILTETAFNDFFKILSEQTELIIDTETTGLDYMQARLVGLSFAFPAVADQAYYIPLRHDYENVAKQLDATKVLSRLKPILENPAVKKIGHHIKYDAHILQHENIHLNGIFFDTLLAAFYFNIDGRLDLDSLALKYLNKHCISFESIAGKGVKQKTFNQIDIQIASEYAAEDAAVTKQLYQYFLKKIDVEPAIKHLFYDMEMPLVSILTAMEHTGVLLDQSLLKTQSEVLAELIEKLEEKAFVLVGEKFNLNSPKQLQHILFEKLQLPISKKTPTGQAATAESVLQALATDYPLPAIILEFRSYSKLKSTYTDKLPLLINKKTGRLHTAYHQVGTYTGRFSSTDPNLQNIPIKTEIGRKIRQAFIAPPSYQLLSADYSQIELRLMAHFSADPQLCKAFHNGVDIHLATAAELFKIPLEKVTTSQRRDAKTVNFALLYGMSAFGLAKQLQLSNQAAQAYIDTYFERYPGVKNFITRIKQEAKENAYITTLGGRKLYLPNINAKNPILRQAAERAAINAPMQASAAELIKKAMCEIDKTLHKKNLDAKMILQVHDELVFEVHYTAAAALSEIVRDKMTSVLQLQVPLLVDIGIGNNWDEAH